MDTEVSAALLNKAQEFKDKKDIASVIDYYEQSLAKLPKEKSTESRRIRLELSKTRIESGQLPQARTELEALHEEIVNDPSANSALRDDVLATLAKSRYYMTYLMKLEGLPDTEWESEIEAARQEQKMLAQQAKDAGNQSDAEKYAHDLEASIRLARTSPEELYGLDIPKQCENCCSGKCKPKAKKKCDKKCEDARGAGPEKPIDGAGS